MRFTDKNSAQVTLLHTICGLFTNPRGGFENCDDKGQRAAAKAAASQEEMDTDKDYAPIRSRPTVPVHFSIDYY